MLTCRPALYSEHQKIVSIAKQAKWTKAFSNEMMFSSPAHYARNWIWVAQLGDDIVAYACIREKVRGGETVLYFVGVDNKHQGNDYGWVLLQAVMEKSVHARMILKCAYDNPAKRFYDRHGFGVLSTDDKYWIMGRTFR